MLLRLRLGGEAEGDRTAEQCAHVATGEGHRGTPLLFFADAILPRRQQDGKASLS